MVSLELPIELITDILSRLPAKSLLRFKSVCKTWYALIENPNFVDKHRESNPNTTSILVNDYEKMYLKEERLYRPIDFDFPFLPPRLCILGTCNGLVCASLSLSCDDIIICNPSTCEYRLIPSPKLWTREIDLVFFGFSSFSDDYKLVRIIYHFSVSNEIVVKAEVYTMSYNIWVEIDVKMGRVNTVDHLVLRGPDDRMPVIINGVCYWRAKSFREKRALSFDISEGIFDEIIIPKNVFFAPVVHCCSLIEFEEEVTIIVIRLEPLERKFDLWVLNENKSSWILKLRIEDFSIVNGPLEKLRGTMHVVGYTRNGELLVREGFWGDWKLVLYNLKSREIKSLPSFRAEMDYYAYFHTESLLSVKLKNEVAESD